MNRASYPQLLLYRDCECACSICAFYTLKVCIEHWIDELIGPADECENCPSKDKAIRYGTEE